MDSRTDFHRQFESLSAKEKLLIKLFILAVEPVYYNAFDEILKKWISQGTQENDFPEKRLQRIGIKRIVN
jgi:hypothetical protein